MTIDFKAEQARVEQAGRDAFNAGKSLAMNPYNYSYSNYWRNGWFGAKRDKIDKRTPKIIAHCLSRREGDEWTCPTCKLRWDVGEERPTCPRS